MRYLHQSYQLAVDCLGRPVADPEKAALKERFDGLHRQVYGASAPDEDAEVVTFRAIAEIAVSRLALPGIEAARGDASAAFTDERALYDLDSGRFVPVRIYDRARLMAGYRIAGTAVIQQFDATTLVLPGQTATVEAHGNLIVDSGESP